jgi:hypothetical protein
MNFEQFILENKRLEELNGKTFTSDKVQDIVFPFVQVEFQDKKYNFGISFDYKIVFKVIDILNLFIRRPNRELAEVIDIIPTKYEFKKAVGEKIDPEKFTKNQRDYMASCILEYPSIKNAIIDSQVTQKLLRNELLKLYNENS